MPWMTIRVVRRRGVDAAPPSVPRIRGMAAPMTGIAGGSKCRRISRGAGSTAGNAIGSTVGVAVGAMVGVGIGMGGTGV